MTQSTLTEHEAVSAALSSTLSRAVREISERHGEPEGAARQRREALESYLKAPLPSRAAHLWKYTDPARFVPADGSIPGADRPLEEMPPAQGLEVERPAPALQALALELESGGVVLVDLDRAIRDGAVLAASPGSPAVSGPAVSGPALSGPAVWSPALGSLVGAQVGRDGHGKFEALNLALWRRGTFLRVPRNLRVESPIHLVHALPASTAGGLVATRLLVVVEEGAEVTVIDECSGGGPGTYLNAAVEVFVGQGARVRLVSVGRLHPAAVHYVTERASVGRDGSLLTTIASLGAGLTKSNFGSHLVGPGANVELFGFLFGEAKQQFHHHTVHDHRAPHTYSNLDFKVVLKQKAQSAYTGLIRIEPDAPRSEAYQENRNLLLDEGTRAESIPELEILTDDVKCTHGATMGSLDPEHVFYLMSRGIDRAEAIRLIVGGFVEPTLSRLPEALRGRLRAHVEERIELM